MQRCAIEPRAHWQAEVEKDGLLWHPSYWSESTYYTLTAADVTAVRSATETLYTLLLEAGDYIRREDLFERFEIPPFIVPAIRQAWQQEPPALNYGRFDFGRDRSGQLKLFEFNCDTPTALLEASVIQWRWKESHFPRHGQANEIHECLLEKWRDIAPYLPSKDVHVMAPVGVHGEEAVTATYMAEIAREAGLKPQFIVPRDVGWDIRRHRFVDVASAPIATLYKLYPWEWLLREPFGRHVPEAATLWIEPVWKCLWSNKAILAVLWDLYPHHPLLLEAAFRPLGDDCVAKPLFGREGRGVRFTREGGEAAGDASLGRDVFQQRWLVQAHDGRYPIIGGWIVDGYFAGIGIREGGIITDNSAAFVPHVVV